MENLFKKEKRNGGKEKKSHRNLPAHLYVDPKLRPNFFNEEEWPKHKERWYSDPAAPPAGLR